MPKITHLNKKGEAHMVNVGDKKISKRYAMAEGFVRVNEEIIEMIKQDNLPKGDLFGSARIAGIMAAKKTSELIPLCHNLVISSIEIEIKLIKNDVHVLSKVKCDGKTGAEMEALTAVSVSCLTIYDMLKGLDKNTFISNIQLLKKSGVSQVTGKENNPISVEDAKKRILKSIKPINKTERINTKDCLNRILSKSIKAKRTQPEFNTSAMDGYAIRKSFLKDLPKDFNIIGETQAGSRNKFKLKKNQAVRVFTGSFLPEGCDKVILQENCDRSGDKILVKEENIESYIRKKGEDFYKNDQCLLKSSLLDSGGIALAGAMNYKSLEVYKKPNIGVIANGNELFEPGSINQQIKQPASSKASIISLINAWGGKAIDLGIAKDTLNSLKTKLQKGLSYDMIVTIGGASVGDYDLVYQSLKEMNFKLNFWKIKMKPGKPLMFGTLKNKPIIGLPGNPVSSIVCAQLFLKQSIYRLQNYNYTENIFYLRLGKDLPENNWRESYIRGYLSKSKNNQIIAMPISNQDSSSLSSFAKANILIIREPNAKKIKKGSIVKALILN